MKLYSYSYDNKTMLRKFTGKLLGKTHKEESSSLKEVARYCKRGVSDLTSLEREEIKNSSIFLIFNYLKSKKHYLRRIF